MKITGTRTVNNQPSKKRHLNVGTWNVRRGLIRRENEIKLLLQEEELDVLFLTETDIRKENVQSYKIKGFDTKLQACKNDGDMVRIIVLIKENVGVEVNLRDDLMSETFPSIWIEMLDRHKSKTVIGGFYRQWSANRKLTVPEQVIQITELCNQISEANSSNEKIIVMGDANLCSEKWLADDYNRKSVSQPLVQCLEQNGLEVQDVGRTYLADHALPDGSVPTSSIDHVYSSLAIRRSLTVKKILNSATDHLPVAVQYSLDLTKVSYQRQITKRSFKNFNKEIWNENLAKQNWAEIEYCLDVDEMVTLFDNNVKRALDLAAPVKTFKIRSNHRFGITEGTKGLMKKRDNVRNKIKKAKGQEKKNLLQQYKILRNKVTSEIRKENINYNNNRIKEANNESELWRVANEVLNPKKENDLKIINTEGKILAEEKEVAEAFNEYFIEKIQLLKENIDRTKVEDPLARLREKMKNNTQKLEFKPVSRKQLGGHMKKLKKKKSSGLDGLSQDHLILGESVLMLPLLVIINQSINQGVFPVDWKVAAVTPVLKKGSPLQLGNYRPVSCLPAASKVLEIVICSQLSRYLETNNLLPTNQHGFRPGRSTMTAWQEIQLDWASKTEKNQVTGVLLWDLSAAFDTLDCEGLCDKLVLFGVQPKSIGWVSSFLTGRSQCVRIGTTLSAPRKVVTGVPQGGVLSPLIFVLFVSDLQEWLHHSSAPTYADDTSTGTSNTCPEKMIKNLESDANQVLKYMASNGLVANAKKTSFLVLNGKNLPENQKVKIGADLVPREKTACLLGIKFQDNQQWKAQISGKGGLLSALNSRHYIIKRLSSHLSKDSIRMLVDGLYMSKIRYGLQLYGTVRLNDLDPVCLELKAVQTKQNDLLRTLNGTKIKDRVSVAYLLAKFNTMSVNQLNAQIKLLEIWKALNQKDYPLKIVQHEVKDKGVTTRAGHESRPCEIGKSVLVQKTSVSDAIRIWNRAPESIKKCKTLYCARKEIKTYAKTLPI